MANRGDGLSATTRWFQQTCLSSACARPSLQGSTTGEE